jgi:hypothetical protein
MDILLPQVEFAYKASRALGIEHTPFEANFGFSLEEPPDPMLSMRPSIPVSQDASSGWNSCKKYTLWYIRCYSCTKR